MDFGLAAVGAVDGRPRRHAGLHGAGAAGRPRGHRAQRHLRARPGALRVVHRPARVRGEDDRRLVAQHAVGADHAPTAHVKTLDQAVERAILRCLEQEPARRPRVGARASAAALPGGDPLAAALAAGETPSPEMVAAAGGEAATVSPYAGARVDRDRRLAAARRAVARRPHAAGGARASDETGRRAARSRRRDSPVARLRRHAGRSRVRAAPRTRDYLQWAAAVTAAAKRAGASWRRPAGRADVLVTHEPGADDPVRQDVGSRSGRPAADDRRHDVAHHRHEGTAADVHGGAAADRAGAAVACGHGLARPVRRRRPRHGDASPSRARQNTARVRRRPARLDGRAAGAAASR